MHSFTERPETDELWLKVLRTVNGVPVRYIEVLTPFFEAQPLEQAWFVDAGLAVTLTQPAAILTPTGFLNAAAPTQDIAFTGTGTLTASAAVFSSASVNEFVRMNGGRLLVTGYTDSQHVTALVLNPLLSQAPAASANGRSCRCPRRSPA